MLRSTRLRRFTVAAWDALAWATAFGVVLLLRYDLSLSDHQSNLVFTYTLVAIAAQLVVGYLVQFYRGRRRVGSFGEVNSLAMLVGSVALATGFAFVVGEREFPRGVAVFVPPIAFGVMAAGRWAFRAVARNELKQNKSGQVAALIYGAGDAGTQVARLVDTADQPPYRVVGFVDDDPAKQFLRIRGYRVLGRGADAIDVAEKQGVEVVILAISGASAHLIQDLNDRCRAAGLKLVVVPPVREMIGGRVALGSLREFDVADLLGRRQIETDLSEVAGYLNGKVVLITGAGGSIGSELARQVSKLGPAKLICLDRDESGLHAVQLSMYGHGLLDTDDMVLCDIRDLDALRAVFLRHRPHVVFHAAALKHLPMLEQYPDEGWKTNVLGTLNVLTCAEEVHVDHFVNISTDKAADATAVLGQTKRLAERLTADFAERTERAYLSVRFGNVLGSRGSVLYSFRAQIERGGPVTVTHPDVTRFFMTIPEACQLVLQAGAIGRPGDVLVLDMGEPVRIVDVATRLIEQSGRDIELRYTGLRPGEKLHEVLLSGAEAGEPSEHPLITQVAVPPITPDEIVEASSWSDLALEDFNDLEGSTV